MVNGIRQFLCLLIVACALTSLAASTSAESIDISVSGGTERIEAIDDNGILFFSLSEFVDIIGGTLDWETVGHQVSYTVDTSRFDFMIDAPFFKLNDSVYNLTYPARYRDGQLYLPVVTFIPFLDRIFPQTISWNDDRRTLRIDSEYFNVTDLAVSEKANGLLLEIFLTHALPYEVFVTEGDWINVSVRDGKVDRSRILSRKDRRFMYNLKAHQVAGAAQISLRLRREVGTWHHRLLSNPPRIQISIADAAFELNPSETLSQIGPDEEIDVIVIDPGHGGQDYGAIGRGGAREKDVVLDIAKKLAKLIRKDKQFKVIMTRDRDVTVPLQKRADIANDAEADLFVSIHANSSTKRHVRGWNVFFLAPALNDSARSVAQLENSAFLREKNAFEVHASVEDDYGAQVDPVLTILNEMIMTEFQAESHDFAMMVDREFRRRIDIPARGVDQAGFFVLNRVFTPSVLVESGFISNSTEENLLKNGKYQQKVAEAIYQAIKRFKAKYED